MRFINNKIWAYNLGNVLPFSTSPGERGSAGFSWSGNFHLSWEEPPQPKLQHVKTLLDEFLTEPRKKANDFPYIIPWNSPSILPADEKKSFKYVNYRLLMNDFAAADADHSVDLGIRPEDRGDWYANSCRAGLMGMLEPYILEQHQENGHVLDPENYHGIPNDDLEGRFEASRYLAKTFRNFLRYETEIETPNFTGFATRKDALTIADPTAPGGIRFNKDFIRNQNADFRKLEPQLLSWIERERNLLVLALRAENKAQDQEDHRWKLLDEVYGFGEHAVECGVVGGVDYDYTTVGRPNIVFDKLLFLESNLLGAVDKNITGAQEALNELRALIGVENPSQANDLTETLYTHLQNDRAKIQLLTTNIPVPVVPPFKTQKEIDLDYIKSIENLLQPAEKAALPASLVGHAGIGSPTQANQSYADFINWLDTAFAADNSFIAEILQKNGDDYVFGAEVIKKAPTLINIVNLIPKIKNSTSAVAAIYNILPEAEHGNFMAQVQAVVADRQPKPIVPPITPPVHPPIGNPLEDALKNIYNSLGKKLKSTLKALYTWELKKEYHTAEKIPQDDKIINSLKEEAAEIISNRIGADKNAVKNELKDSAIFTKLIDQRINALIQNNFSVGLIDSKIEDEKNNVPGKRDVKYGGIGADVSYDAKKGGLVINCLISDYLPEDKQSAAQKDLPAYKAGLKANDVITAFYFTDEQLQSLRILAERKDIFTRKPEAKDLKEAIAQFEDNFKQADANGLYKLSLSGLDKRQAELASALSRGMPGSTLLYEVAGRDKPIAIERELINAKPKHCCVHDDKKHWQEKTSVTGNHGRAV